MFDATTTAKKKKITVLNYVADSTRGICVLEGLVFANCIMLNKII